MALDAEQDQNQKRTDQDLYQEFRKKHRYLPEVRSDDDPLKGPLQRISKSYNNTFLHMAIRFKQKELVGKLIEMLPKDEENKFQLPLWEIKNTEGNTILHELVATSTADCSFKELATHVLKNSKEKDQELLITARNKLGETPIFCAARHGQTEMFDFLAEEMKLTKEGPEDRKPYLRRNDGTTVLHISIFTESFELAYGIADRYRYLIVERDNDLMTAFQYLVCNPTAFGRKKQKIGQGFMEHLMKSSSLREVKLHEWFPDNKKTIDERNHQTLKDLVELLVIEDTTWHGSKTEDIESSQQDNGINSQDSNGQHSDEKELKTNLSPKMNVIGQESQDEKVQNLDGQVDSDSKYKKGNESPLLLATISNIPEIVEAILLHHPETLEHTNKEGMNVLQLAILYRHSEIFDMVVNSDVLTSSLLSATDDKGNSLLHMVGQKRKSQASERMQCPAFQLQKELLFFENVKSASKMHLTKPLNKEKKTADELFATNNEKLHGEAKEWLMHTTENCTILSVFIATVAFAAAYTVPGGSNGNTGIPILHSKPFFLVFILADVLSLALALTSMGIFLSILTSSFPLQHFQTYLFSKLKHGMISMIASVTMMAVAFGATVALIMTHDRMKVVWYVVAFLPVPIFFISYSPLRSAFLGLCEEWSKNYVRKLVKGVAWTVVIFIALLFYLLYQVCRYTVYKPVCWIFDCGKKPQPDSGTQISQV